MKLSQREERAIERLRQLEKHWPWLRWAILVFGLFALGAAAYVYRLALDLAPQVETTGNYRVTFFFTYGALGAGFAILAYIALTSLTWLVARWRGDPIRTVLLRLLDERSQLS